MRVNYMFPVYQFNNSGVGGGGRGRGVASVKANIRGSGVTARVNVTRIQLFPVISEPNYR